MTKVLVTGAAGFIGSHLVERLLAHDYQVFGLDNYVNSSIANVEAVYKSARITDEQRRRYDFAVCDVTDIQALKAIFEFFRPNIVMHQAALGSIPRSLANPFATMHNNVNGFHNILEMCRAYKILRLIFASSSSVYGSNPRMIKKEHETGVALNPYALSKLMNEHQAATWARSFGVESIGLRYFNIFGPRQRQDGEYAAVIAKWLGCIKSGDPIVVNGTGDQLRDFTFIDNCTLANMLAMTTHQPDAVNKVYNVGCGHGISLKQVLREVQFHAKRLGHKIPKIEYAPARINDIQGTCADLTIAKKWLGYESSTTWQKGVQLTCESVLSATAS